MNLVKLTDNQFYEFALITVLVVTAGTLAQRFLSLKATSARLFRVHHG